MEVHIPKPVHGWGQLFVELATIVFGVGIALVGEQVVEARHWRHEVADATDAVMRELVNDDLEQAFERAMAEKCLQRQLDTMKTMIEASPTLDGFEQRARAYNAPVYSWDTDAWKTMQTSGVTLHIGAVRTTGIASVYALIPRLQEVNWREGDLMWDLVSQRIPRTRATEAQKDRLWSTIFRLSQVNMVMAEDAREVLKQARDLDIHIPRKRLQELVDGLKASDGPCDAGHLAPPKPEQTAAAPAVEVRGIA
jgi:hypothetical protein